MRRIDSISKMFESGMIRYRVDLCQNHTFAMSGTDRQYCDSVNEIYQLTKEIVYCDGQ